MKKSKVLCVVLFSGCFLQGKVPVLYWILCLIYVQKKNIKVITSHHALSVPLPRHAMLTRHPPVAILTISPDKCNNGRISIEHFIEMFKGELENCSVGYNVLKVRSGHQYTFPSTDYYIYLVMQCQSPSLLIDL